MELKFKDYTRNKYKEMEILKKAKEYIEQLETTSITRKRTI